jgi:serine O-acetyltransferase
LVKLLITNGHNEQPEFNPDRGIDMTFFNYVSNNLVKEIVHSVRIAAFTRRSRSQALSLPMLAGVPAKAAAHHFADELFNFLFSANEQRPSKVAGQQKQLMKDLRHLLRPLSMDSEQVSEAFFDGLPALQRKLLTDAEAALASDPAATSLEEVIFTYPGFYAIAIYRLAHELVRLDVPLLPRMLTEYAHGQTGIDIHPTAKIGCAFVIDHGTGTVIGATAEIGHHVQLYHGVTLGALQVDKSMANTKRHPTIEDHVTIYANATVLGGETVVGHHSLVGGNVWLIHSVSPHSRIYHEGSPKIRTRSRKS